MKNPFSFNKQGRSQQRLAGIGGQRGSEVLMVSSPQSALLEYTNVAAVHLEPV